MGSFRHSRSRLGKPSLLRFPFFSLSFDDEGLVEISSLPDSSLTSDGIDLFHDWTAIGQLRARTDAAFLGVGLLVLPDLGLSIADVDKQGRRIKGEELQAITTFVRGRFDGVLDGFARLT